MAPLFSKFLFTLSLSQSVSVSAISLHKLTLRRNSNSTDNNILETGTDLPKVTQEYNTNKDAGIVHKDGYSYVECITDELFLNGDKHGENKMDFNEDTPVSIVRYENVAGVTENAATSGGGDGGGMTQEKCFSFCKQLTSNVKFFGLVNGGDSGTGACYCSSHYVQTAGKNEECNVPCSGDKSQFCGGTTKSAIFEMHDCEEPVAFSEEKLSNFTQLGQDLVDSYEAAKECSEDLLHLGQKIADTAGKNGNQVAMEHQQDMISSYKSIWGNLKKGMSIGETNLGAFNDLGSALKSSVGVYSDTNSNSTSSSGTNLMNHNVNAAQKARAELESLVEKAESAINVVEGIEDSCVLKKFNKNDDSLETDDGTDSAISESDLDSESPDSDFPTRFYISASKGYSTSCGGSPILPVMMTSSVEECAAQCRSTLNPEKCVGYQIYSDSTSKMSCQMFSQFKEMVRYTKDKKSCSGGGSGVDGECFVTLVDETTQSMLKEGEKKIDTCFSE